MYSNTPSTENISTKPAMLVPRNGRLRKIASGRIGASLRRSITTNSASATTEPARRPMMRAEVQPHELASITASTPAVRPSDSVTIPA